MEIAVKVAVFGIIFTILAVLLSEKAPELAVVFSVAAVIFIIGAVLPGVFALWRTLGELALALDIPYSLTLPAIKIVGIAIATRISAELCRDNDQKALGTAIELSGVVCALLVALPLFLRAFELLGDVL